jgi:hypothetical protein
LDSCFNCSFHLFIEKVYSYSKDDGAEVIKPQPEWLSYTKDIFKRWTWVWKYELNYYGKYEIIHLIPLCSKCNYKMRGGESRSTFNTYSCPNCKNTYNNLEYWEYKGDIEALIIHNLEHSTYKIS